MATLNTTLSITSATVSSNALSLSISDVLAVGNPIQGLSRESIGTSNPVELIPASVSADTYIYIKNTDTTNFLFLKTAGGQTYAKLSSLEAILICVYGGIGVEVLADTAAIIAEYATFTKV